MSGMWAALGGESDRSKHRMNIRQSIRATIALFEWHVQSIALIGWRVPSSNAVHIRNKDHCFSAVKNMKLNQTMTFLEFFLLLSYARNSSIRSFVSFSIPFGFIWKFTLKLALFTIQQVKKGFALAINDVLSHRLRHETDFFVIHNVDPLYTRIGTQNGYFYHKRQLLCKFTYTFGY